MRIDLTRHPFLRSPLLRKRWLRHLLFWLSYVSFYALSAGVDDLGHAFLAELVLLPVKMVTVYFTLYCLIPRLLLRERHGWFALGVGALFIGAVFVQRAIIYYVLLPQLYPGMPYGAYLDATQLIRYALTILSVLVLASAIKIVKYWYQDQQTAKAMIQAKLEAELKFLKAQIHPHFLFNTLNNLYALTLKQSERAPEVVLRLSSLVDYMLHEATAPEVPLTREIETMHNYIALERIRYGHNLDIFFDVSGHISQVQVAPLLLLPFVENSFKHGVSDDIEDKWIRINLNFNAPHLSFKVENSRSASGNREEKDYAGGIGLRNVKRRLELLYPNRHELKIRDEAHSYFVVLRLDLSAPARVRVGGHA